MPIIPMLLTNKGLSSLPTDPKRSGTTGTKQDIYTAYSNFYPRRLSYTESDILWTNDKYYIPVLQNVDSDRAIQGQKLARKPLQK